MPIPFLTEAIIRRQATPESFRRGERYYGDGAVVSLVARGNVVEAEVFGSQYQPYGVRITFDEGGVTGAFCSCPYAWDGWCKHIVAALLACLHEPDLIEARRTLDELLADLDREQLRDLLLRLAAGDPSEVDRIERLVALSQATPAASEAVGPPAPTPQPRTQLDPQPIRRQVSGILHSLDHMRRSEAYWHVSSVVNEVHQLLAHAQDLIDAESGRDGLLFLEAITDEYVAGWTALDDSDGVVGGFFGVLGEAWLEAAVAIEDLASDERERWAETLTRWQAELDDYGLGGVFDPALALGGRGGPAAWLATDAGCRSP